MGFGGVFLEVSSGFGGLFKRFLRAWFLLKGSSKSSAWVLYKGFQGFGFRFAQFRHFRSESFRFRVLCSEGSLCFKLRRLRFSVLRMSGGEFWA